MIHYIVGRNLGHLSRCVANLSAFSEASRESVKVYGFKQSHSWLKSNLPQVKIRDFNKKLKDKSGDLLNANLIIHDWRKEVEKLKEKRGEEGPIIAGIYHSDMVETKGDTAWTARFKREIHEVAEKTTDVFFHINLTQPSTAPKLSTWYVPIPMITRKISMKPAQVKKILGIPANEPFILIHMGGGIGMYRYKYMKEWYEKINRMRLPYRIVIANQLGGVKYRFRKSYIMAPLFANGRELIHAASAVISKPGMGILMDCVSTGTPLLALPADSKEREVKNMMLRDLVDSNICLASPNFSSSDLAKRTREIVKHRKMFKKAFEKVPRNGAEIAAKSMVLLSNHSLKDLPDLYEELLSYTPYKIK